MSNQIFPVMKYVQYMKNWYIACCRFFVIPLVCAIPEDTRNDYFYWYMAGIGRNVVYVRSDCYMGDMRTREKEKGLPRVMGQARFKTWIWLGIL